MPLIHCPLLNMNKLDIMYKQIKATMDIMYMFLFKDLPITYLLITWWSGKKKDQILIVCIFWRRACARVRFPAGLKCGLNYLKGKGLKIISKLVFAATIYQIWLQRNKRINNSRILLERTVLSRILGML